MKHSDFVYAYDYHYMHLDIAARINLFEVMKEDKTYPHWVVVLVISVLKMCDIILIFPEISNEAFAVSWLLGYNELFVISSTMAFAILQYRFYVNHVRSVIIVNKLLITRTCFRRCFA